MANSPYLEFPRPARGEPLVVEVIDNALLVLEDAIVNGLGGSTIRANLVAAWRLDEASGTRVDAVGSNHLSDNNTVTQAIGKLGFGAQFTAANSEYLSIADNADISTGDIDFTWAGWVYFDTLGADRCLVGKWATGQLEYILQYANATSKITFFASSNGTTFTSIAASTTQTTATWYFVVAWHDSVANTINIQINDGATASVAHTTGVFNGTASLRFGQNETIPGNYMNGRLDEWAFWKRVLTAGERTTLYNLGNGTAFPF